MESKVFVNLDFLFYFNIRMALVVFFVFKKDRVTLSIYVIKCVAHVRVRAYTSTRVCVCVCSGKLKLKMNVNGEFSHLQFFAPTTHPTPPQSHAQTHARARPCCGTSFSLITLYPQFRNKTKLAAAVKIKEESSICLEKHIVRII